MHWRFTQQESSQHFSPALKILAFSAAKRSIRLSSKGARQTQGRVNAAFVSDSGCWCLKVQVVSSQSGVVVVRACWDEYLTNPRMLRY
jgi:hypothetical protein